jgi:hypothetical protein
MHSSSGCSVMVAAVLWEQQLLLHPLAAPTKPRGGGGGIRYWWRCHAARGHGCDAEY